MAHLGAIFGRRLSKDERKCIQEPNYGFQDCDDCIDYTPFGDIEQYWSPFGVRSECDLDVLRAE